MLNKGEVIIFPTDTVYGIGASAFDKEALERIYEIKNRPANKRLSILCASLEDIKKIAVVSDDALKLIKEFFPGALTLILPTKKEVICDSIFETVGVRIPNHKLALEILRENGPMATTSVNLSGEAPLNDYKTIVEVFGSKVNQVYENAEIPSEVSSTVVNLTTTPYSLIREGTISFEKIINYLNK